jgi:hypothetical protein
VINKEVTVKARVRQHMEESDWSQRTNAELVVHYLDLTNVQGAYTWAKEALNAMTEEGLLERDLLGLQGTFYYSRKFDEAKD